MTDVKENVKKISADIRENERYIQERCENCADILEAVLMEAGILTEYRQNPDQTADQL